MSTIQFSNIKNVHFIGIGGIGMSALARLCVYEGKAVSGSDMRETELSKKLATEGMEIAYRQEAENIRPESDLFIYSEAVGENNEELVAARATGVPTINYFQALALVANEYYLIAVSGTHGKTTTTAMLADIFEVAELDPTVVVGSLRAKTGSNYRAGKSKYFIAEACEYKDDFLALEPDMLIINNIEHDHVDHFASLGDVQAAFRKLVAKVPEDGFVIANQSDENVAAVLTAATATVVDYTKFFDPTRQLKLPGIHNQMNAAAAAAAATQVGIVEADITTALSAFSSTWRRFQHIGNLNGAPLYNDYAHHPTAIRFTIMGARELYPDRKIVAVFQPHTYSRTHALFDDFVEALSGADETLLLPIYAAREENESGVSSVRLAEESGAQYVESIPEVAEVVQNIADENTVILLMGAGDVTKVGDILTNSQ